MTMTMPFVLIMLTCTFISLVKRPLVVPLAEFNPTHMRIEINTADLHTLTLLPGIGSARAQRIIEYRRIRNGFTSVNQLTEIRSIGTSTLDRIRPFITCYPQSSHLNRGLDTELTYRHSRSNRQRIGSQN